MLGKKLLGRMKDFVPQAALEKMEEFKDSMSSEVSKRVDNVKRRVDDVIPAVKSKISDRIDDVKSYVSPAPLPVPEYREVDDLVFVSETAEAHSDAALQPGRNEAREAFERLMSEEIAAAKAAVRKSVAEEDQRRKEFDLQQKYYQDCIQKGNSARFYQERARMEADAEAEYRKAWREEQEDIIDEINKEIHFVGDGFPLVPDTPITYSDLDWIFDRLSDSSVRTIIYRIRTEDFYDNWIELVTEELTDLGYVDIGRILQTVTQEYPMSFGPSYPISESERKEILESGIPPELWKTLRRRAERRRRLQFIRA